MPSVNPIQRRDLIVLALILFVAALVRLGDPAVVEFKLDEAALAIKAQEMLRGAGVPFVGIPSSVGLPNSPISVYFVAIPYLFGNDPIFATMFIAAFNVLGVGLLWGIAHRYLDKTVGLAAGLAYALNPWAVLYSRKIWEQNIHTPIFLAALLFGLLGFVEGKKWAQVLCAPLLLLALQIHPAGWALLPLALVLLWMGRKRISWPAAAASLALAVVVMLPYLIGIQQTLSNDPGLFGALGSRSSSRGLSLKIDALRWTTDLATGIGIETQLTPGEMDDLLRRVPPQTQLWALLGAVTLAGFGLIWTTRYRRMALLVLLWVLLPLIVFTPAWTQVFPHYLIASIPALSLLAGVTVGWLARHLPGKPLSRVVILTAFIAILLTQGLWWRGLMRYVESVPTSWPGFMTPLNKLVAIRDSLAQDKDVIAVVPNANVVTSIEPAIWTSLLMQPGRCVRSVDSRSLLVFPADRFTALVAPDTPDSPAKKFYTQAQPAQSYDVVSPAGQYSRYDYDSAPRYAGPALTRIGPVKFANGAQAIGYALTSAGVVLAWTLPGPTTVDSALFVHLLDADGAKVAQKDQPFFASRYWCAGDRIVTGTQLDLPQTMATLRFGLYSRDGKAIRNIATLDANDQPGGSWVDIKIPSPPAPN